ncbi:hypothetical protein ACRAWD_21415 [Caulobacter segnis]
MSIQGDGSPQLCRFRGERDRLHTLDYRASGLPRDRGHVAVGQHPALPAPGPTRSSPGAMRLRTVAHRRPARSADPGPAGCRGTLTPTGSPGREAG